MVLHHDLGPVERFLTEADRQQLNLQEIFGIFYYRSACPRTLRLPSRYLPVPATHLSNEFHSGLSAVDICARSIATFRQFGVQHLYVSNLPSAQL